MSPDSPETDASSSTKTDLLLRDLQRSADRTYHLNRRTRALCRFFLCCFLLCGIPLLPELGFTWPGLTPYLPMLSSLRMLFLGAFCIANIPDLALVARAFLSRGRLRSLIVALKDDVRAVGPLAQLCHRLGYFSVANSAVEALLSLLPQMKAGDGRYLSDSQMKALLALLNVSGHRAFDPDRFQKSPFYRFSVAVAGQSSFDTGRVDKLPIAILEALQRAGDSRAIAGVRRLATNRLNAQYRWQAQECLAVLERHREKRDYNRTLLTPSSAGVGEDTLLRAALPQAEIQQELLLRAVGDEERG
jgi:hypothetical protein